MDRYTKTILTVIAACLLIQTADRLFAPTPAHAAGAVTPVVIVGVEKARQWSFKDALPVEIRR